MENKVSILKINRITQDVKLFTIEKPKSYTFKPGEHASISLDNPESKDKKRPFSFISKPSNSNLEIAIKIYFEHNGITKEINNLRVGDNLILGESSGNLLYKKPGIFIAGGMGITPFLSIFRSLNEEELKKNKLIYSNKTKEDIFAESELIKLLPEKSLIQILTREENPKYEYGHIDKKFLEKNIKNINQNFYICGPPMFVREIKKTLLNLKIKEKNIITE